MKLLLDMDKQEDSGDCDGVGGAMDIMGMYGHSATIHGVSKVADPQIYRFRRWVWSILLISMAVGLAVVLYMQFTRFFEYPTVTMVNAEFHDELRFPAITICNINQYDRVRLPFAEDLRTLLYNLSEFSDLQGYLEHIDQRNYHYSSPMSPVDPGTYLYDSVMYAAPLLEELFLLCMWKGKKLDCQDVMERVITDVGVCYRFNGNISDPYIAGDTGPNHGLRVLLDIKQNNSFFSSTSQSGVKILVNEPDEAPILDNAGWFVRPGTSSNIGIRKEEFIGLKKPYKSFGTSYCLDTQQDGFKTPLSRYPDYSYTRSTCRKECLLKYFGEKCNCRHFFVPGPERYCSIYEFNECLLPAMRDSEIGKMMESCKGCPSTCQTVGYIPNLSSADFASSFIIDYMVTSGLLKDSQYMSNNVVDLRIYFDSLTVTQIQQKPELTIQGILADLGGLMGMFLGASILSITELVEFLALVCLAGRNRRKVSDNRTKTNSRNETEMERKNVDDVKF
ncbi:hypothetical protein LOTGIDRAFT_168888 [Lottia gigantea]|uniref:Uncharacterized protein n=1 Tax=Lottia gigantea TaxID=225164 RepID=V4B5N4_LOTGI|nr:hypothetical protein LOTGIDRAFT_168888 [Lottia gigantea]ESO83844.1 hypothetical protein LOTGIDRAFT_168888 [Lottia gigantea]